MFSSIFVDRPRLAVVIALVTAIAGLVSLLTIPIAQFPDIVAAGFGERKLSRRVI
jgi:multidrug efflux pump subunit AcrB